MVASGDTGLENHAGRLTGADPRCDFMEASWGSAGFLNIGGRAPRSRNQVALNQHTLGEVLHRRCADTHDENPFSGLDAEAGAGFVDQLQRRFFREKRIH